jgi:hypothetical protein
LLEILRFAQDFACGLPLGFTSLTPAKRLNFGITPNRKQSALFSARGLPTFSPTTSEDTVIQSEPGANATGESKDPTDVQQPR